jgi:hypothetical protein
MNVPAFAAVQASVPEPVPSPTWNEYKVGGAAVVVDVVGAAVVDVLVVDVLVVVVGNATCIGSNPMMLAAVDEADTAPINHGINPDADINVNTLPFIVFTTNVPGVPT